VVEAESNTSTELPVVPKPRYTSSHSTSTKALNSLGTTALGRFNDRADRLKVDNSSC
jgi:hypothetical protein